MSPTLTGNFKQPMPIIKKKVFPGVKKARKTVKKGKVPFDEDLMLMLRRSKFSPATLETPKWARILDTGKKKKKWYEGGGRKETRSLEDQRKLDEEVFGSEKVKDIESRDLSENVFSSLSGKKKKKKYKLIYEYDQTVVTTEEAAKMMELGTVNYVTGKTPVQVYASNMRALPLIDTSILPKASIVSKPVIIERPIEIPLVATKGLPDLATSVRTDSLLSIKSNTLVGQRLDTGLQSNTMQDVGVVSLTKVATLPKLGVVQDVSQKLDLGSALVSKNIVLSKFKSRMVTPVTSITKNPPSPSKVGEPFIEVPKSVPRPKPPKRPPNRKPPTRLPDLEKKKGKNFMPMQNLNMQGFAVDIKRGGKFVRVGGTLIKEAALDLGAALTVKSLAAQFRIRPVSERPSVVKTTGAYGSYRGQFRSYKIKGGKKVVLPEGQFIQKKTKRLKSKQEVKEIMFAKISKSNYIKKKGGFL